MGAAPARQYPPGGPSKAEGRCPCPECPEILASERTLIMHKHDMIERGEGHLKCNICNLDHHTAEAYNIHHRLNHSAEQNLGCPGCGQTFIRAGGLMSHIEHNECRRIDKDYIITKRHEKVALARALKERDSFPADPTRHDGDFGQYLCIPAEDTKPEKGIAALNFDLHEKPTADFDLDADFPKDALLGTHYKDREPRLRLTKENVAALDQGGNPWVTSKTLFPDAPVAEHPTEGQLKAIRQPAKTKENAWAPYDPKNPTFNPMTYFVEASEKFRCPHHICMKSFKSRQGFIMHLESPAHRFAAQHREKYICPYCNKRFGDATALVQHSEAQGLRCRQPNADTKEYRQFLGQLTGGLTDIGGLHGDRTRQYVVTDQAKGDFSAPAVTPAGEVAPENKKTAKQKNWEPWNAPSMTPKEVEEAKARLLRENPACW